ncbi:protein serine/threonine kinase [Tieghemostelium lacteum]|uniref:non-specific serine/threonine protein kinase n=1 Tax=Tieghemostelium lacteum TaxID=361077 RepID=A0A152A8I3_TIELA|nr:protein serine/threonine kinase [Tieghemostelium lacteum]|eukprot:KYR02514.1 protein serine/threonine kinase [Tieghemostelium lacteum]
MDGYEILGPLGKGSFGSVSKIKRKSDGKILVWKEICYAHMEEKEKQLLVNEVNILQKLKHANIVRCYDRIIEKSTSKIYIVMEFCSGGDLSQLIRKCRHDQQYIDEEVIWRTLIQILGALSEIHNRKDGIILHRDIKPGNLFLDENRNVKLGDFGLAKILDGSAYAHTFVGTPYYMSPEQINGQAYNDRSDVWSVGCLVYEMASLVPPFSAQTPQVLSQKIQAGRFSPIPPHFSSDLSKIINMMINVDPTRRPSVDELLNLPFLSVRVRERKVNMYYQNLKQMEEDIKIREKQCQEKEKQLQLKEQQLIQREKLLMEKENIDQSNNNNILQSNQNIKLQQQPIYNTVPTPLYTQNTQPLFAPQVHQPLRRQNTTPIFK